MSDIELDEIAGRLDDLPLFDVRSPGEYDGTHGKPCDPRQGHLPGARNLDVHELLQLTPEEIGERLALPEGAELVVY